MSHPASETRRLFSRLAPRYDLLNHLLSLNRDRAWRRRACRMAPTEPGALVLDLCAGTGDLALEYLAQYPRVGAVVLADFAEPMLHLARQKAARHAGAKLELLSADALRLPFRDAAFDLVMVAFGVRNFEDTQAGLAEMARVTRPGGQVLILEFMRPEPGGLGRLGHRAVQAWVAATGGLVSGQPGAYRYLASSVDSFLSRDELRAALADAGYKGVRSDEMTLGIATAFTGRRRA